MNNYIQLIIKKNKCLIICCIPEKVVPLGVKIQKMKYCFRMRWSVRRDD